MNCTLISSAQVSTVKLPRSLPCKGCTIRLVRQAGEWGKSYLFWSCADIDLISVQEFTVVCSGRGHIERGHCVCDHLYSGNVCQYQVWNIFSD